MQIYPIMRGQQGWIYISINNVVVIGWGSSSIAECLCGVHKALGSVLSTELYIVGTCLQFLMLGI